MVSEHDLHERVARLEQSNVTLKEDVSNIAADVKKLLAAFNEMTGGRKMLLAVFSLTGAISAIIGAAVTIIVQRLTGR